MTTLISPPQLIPDIDPRYQVPDELWERFHPLIPPALPKPQGGRPRMDDRRALNGIFYVLCTGLSVERLTPVFRRSQYRS